MTQPFKCPSCGGPLEYDGGEVTVRCEFCSNLVIVPEDLQARFDHKRDGVPFLEQLANLKEIGRLIRDGNLIAAIKLYRQTFGVGLQEAKSAVEKLAGGKPVEVSSTFGVGSRQAASVQRTYIKSQQSGPSIRLKGCSPLVLALVISVPILCAGSSVAFFVFTGFRELVTRTVSRGKKPNQQKDRPVSGFAREVMRFGREGIGPGQFKDARTVAIDGSGNIFAADYSGGRVQVFDSSGKFLTQWMVDSKFPLVKLAADRKGTVYIVQRGYINRYEGMTGKPLGKIPSGGKSFDDVVVSLDGRLVAVENNENLVRMDANGNVETTIKKPISTQTDRSELSAKVAVDGFGNIYAMGRFNNAVFKFAPDGKFITRIGGEGEEPGLFRALNGIAVDGKGRVYVSDIKGIQVFDSNGRYLDVFNFDRNVAFGMVFDDKDELFVAGRTQIVKFALNK